MEFIGSILATGWGSFAGFIVVMLAFYGTVTIVTKVGNYIADKWRKLWS